MNSALPQRRILSPRRFNNLRGRQKTGFILGVVVLIALIIWLISWLDWRFAHVAENDAHIAGEVVTLASRVDGWLVARPVMDGDHVKKGQMLARIDDRDAKLRLAAVQGDLASANAQILYTQAQRQTADLTTQAELEQAQAQLTVAESTLSDAGHQLTLAQANFQRDDSLVKSGLTPRKTWDESHTAVLQRQDQLREAEAQLLSQRAALANARAQRGQLQVLDRQIDMQRQQVVTLTAQAQQITQEIADRTLRSPVDGVVDRTLADVGDYVQAGQWVMMVHDPKNVWVEANVKETELDHVAVGQGVDVTVDAYPGLVSHGHVIRVGNTATNQFALLPSPNPSGNFTKITQRVPVRIALDTVDGRIKPGLMVEVAIDVAH
ncbi:HlyD family secretion protein [Acerihabitans arboris]|uniref:HlyD family efflux transporter periplasmic adaptor subunit n=1 Tax=Acerihabitans arboris TaxID=2691583 RepID=A0A845SHV1_9GAMM|nr:HlyD family secretion protein [Acerihabitans arboris]NDL63469.1 HlyD family efflux transporter periplasmic adaptor subunit [Acerihabitans arboris]